MLKRTRRVVASLAPDGRSAVLVDGECPTAAENPNWPGFGVKLLWVSDASPAPNRPGTDEGARPMTILPEGNGTTFVLCQFPPLAELERMTPEARKKAETLVFGGVGTDERLSLHATPTIDYLVMIEGELTLILESGETTLKAGDILIDCGVKHGWENRGTVPALCAVTMVPLAPASG